MKYSVFTVLNSAYMKFGKIWINSFYDKIDISNIKKFILVIQVLIVMIKII